MKYLIKNHSHRKRALSGSNGETVIIAPNATQIEELRELTETQVQNLLAQGLDVTAASAEDEAALEEISKPKAPTKKAAAPKKAAATAPDTQPTEPKAPEPAQPPAQPDNADVGAAPWQKGLGA